MSKPRKQTPIDQSPVLTWPGKHSPTPTAPRPLALVEVFAPQPASCRAHPTGASLECNALYYGDNRDILTHLLATGYRGQVRLIYIDPPYASGVKWGRKLRLRGPKAPTMQTNAKQIFAQQTQFSDQWDANDYLQFIYERLPLLRDLLAEDGSLWLHCDHRQAHHLRVLLQEVFGADNYLNTITWRSQVARGAKVNAFYFPFSAHYIEIFAKNRQAPTVWNPLKKQTVLSAAEAAREFMHDEHGFFRTSDPGTYSFAHLKAFYAAGRLYAPYGGEIIIDEAEQRVYASQGGNIAVKYYLTAMGKNKWAVERAIDNLWDDIPGLGTTPAEDLGYPTQKTEALLARIIRTATNPGDLVLDCFMGSGTTLAVAQQLGRQWIGCDNNWGALVTTRRRLQTLRPLGTVGNPGFAVYREQTDENDPDPTSMSSLQAQIVMARNPLNWAEICVQIVDVESPLITALLAQQAKPHPVTRENWRLLVDAVAIDPDYNGHVFQSCLVDAPRKKSEQVKGNYTVVAPVTTTIVAVRVTDLLGDELLIVQEIG